MSFAAIAVVAFIAAIVIGSLIDIKEQPKRPRVTDNDRGSAVVTYEGRQMRGWSYQGNDERRKKMMHAREHIEGWCDSREHITLSDLDRLKDMFP
jgi:hypothetical protein